MALFESRIDSLERIGKGKVRDIYAVDKDKMLIVTSDRLSAFDVVLSDPIPDKGTLVGHFIKYVDTLNSGGGINPCDPNSFGACVPVMTK